MNVIKKNQSINRQQVIADEAEKLRHLIERRHQWLAKPENKMKGTFGAVLADTIEMEAELKMIETNLIEA